MHRSGNCARRLDMAREHSIPMARLSSILADQEGRGLHFRQSVRDDSSLEDSPYSLSPAFARSNRSRSSSRIIIAQNSPERISASPMWTPNFKAAIKSSARRTSRPFSDAWAASSLSKRKWSHRPSSSGASRQRPGSPKRAHAGRRVTGAGLRARLWRRFWRRGT